MRTWARGWLSAIAYLAIALSNAGCEERSCTLAGCDSGLDVCVLPNEDVDLVPGQYRITAVMDGTTLAATCDPTIGDNGKECVFEGSDDQPKLVFAFRASMCGKHDLDGKTMLRLWLLDLSTGGATGPAKLELTIDRDDERIVETTIEPTYPVVYPNGPDCGWCGYAAVDVEMLSSGKQP